MYDCFAHRFQALSDISSLLGVSCLICVSLGQGSSSFTIKRAILAPLTLQKQNTASKVWIGPSRLLIGPDEHSIILSHVAIYSHYLLGNTVFWVQQCKCMLFLFGDVITNINTKLSTCEVKKVFTGTCRLPFLAHLVWIICAWINDSRVHRDLRGFKEQSLNDTAW